MSSHDDNLFSDPEEQRVFLAALDSFRQYRKTAHYNVTHRRRQNFYALPTSQWRMLSAPPFNLLKTLERVDNAIDANADIADEIVRTTLDTFCGGFDTSTWHGKATSSDLDKARSTMRQFYRDWSAEGIRERQACYDPVLRALDQAFSNQKPKSSVRVLVPGAGLGRLVFEVCRAGYTVEGNEISYHQLLASNWVLNHVAPDRKYELYPFALDFSNVHKREHQLTKFEIPDIHATTALGSENVAESDRMSVGAADFTTVYRDEERAATFDAIATVFFIDTAPNVIRYIETIHNCLKTGGIWINVGPLLWHFADRAPSETDEHVRPDQSPEKAGIEAPGSFELTNEELLLLVDRMGFEIEKHEVMANAQGYIQNPNSMLQNNYRCSHWTARKATKIDP